MSDSIRKYEELLEAGRITSETIPQLRYIPQPRVYTEAEVVKLLDNLKQVYEKYYKSDAPWESRWEKSFEKWVHDNLK